MPMQNYGRLIAFLVILVSAGWHAQAKELLTPQDVVAAFNEALIAGDSDALQGTLAAHISMFNGAGSTDVSQWQPHMYLSGLDVKEWADFMVASAGPHENVFEFVTVEERANMALVVTLETGRNKFLTWEASERMYLLGRGEEGWRIVGLFLPDVSNPE